MPETLLALTIKQPWQWAVSKGLKPAENRTWKPHDAVVGRYLALHAGKEYDDDKGVAAFTEIIGAPGMRERVAAINGDEPLTLRLMPLGAITCVARLARVVTSAEELPELARPWVCGPFAWVFEDVQEIEPVQCRGMQKLWAVPPDVAELVRHRWRVARGACTAGVPAVPPSNASPAGPGGSSTCRSCGAAVTWCMTSKGKRMPVDAEARPGGNIVLEPSKAVGVPPLAKYVRQGGGMHTSHFATCPNAKTWRKDDR